MMNQQKLLKAAIVGVLLRNRYLADWHIADMLEIPRDEFGGCGTPGPGGDAIHLLVKDGIIEPMPDLGCRYRIVGATIPALESQLADCQAATLPADDLRRLAANTVTIIATLHNKIDTEELWGLAERAVQAADSIDQNAQK